MRILNSTGLVRFREFLEDGAVSGGLPPLHLIEARETSSMLDFPLVIDEETIFGNKLDFAEYIHQQITVAGASHQEVSQNAGLWSTLVLIYFDQFCPLQQGGRDVKKEKSSLEMFPKYIPQIVERAGSRGLRGRRHLALGPYLVFHRFQSLPHKGDVFLSGDLHVWGDDIEQVIGRTRVFSNLNLANVIRRLYWDEERMALKTGYSSRKRPGNLLRLVGDLRRQMELTYDWHSMSEEEIIALLPTEYDDWVARPDKKA